MNEQSLDRLAPANQPEKAATKGKTVSLVLGSGGARGLTHIGVIDWLNQNHYHIASIVGSSMGALIGGIYAAGQLQVYVDWVTRLSRFEVFRLLDFTFTRSGLFRGERIISVLKELVGERNIEDLSIPFTAVATDLYRQKEVWIHHGPLFDAIRASIAIPLIFTPVERNGRQLVDGGLINPLPIAPTMKDHTDLTIAVNLSGQAEGREPEKHDLLVTEVEEAKDDAERSYVEAITAFIMGSAKKKKQVQSRMGMIDVAFEAIDTMQNAVARLKMAAYSPDVVIDIPRNACSFYDFHRGTEMIQLGRKRAAIALAQYHEKVNNVPSSQ